MTPHQTYSVGRLSTSHRDDPNPKLTEVAEQSAKTYLVLERHSGAQALPAFLSYDDLIGARRGATPSDFAVRAASHHLASLSYRWSYVRRGWRRHASFAAS